MTCEWNGSQPPPPPPKWWEVILAILIFTTLITCAWIGLSREISP